MSTEQCKVALVTGGSRGIGRATCLRLAEEGFAVAINYRTDERAAAEVGEVIERSGRPAVTIRADVGNPNEVAAMFRRLDEQFGRIDVLVNNAGIRNDRLFLMAAPEAWWQVVQTNLGSVVNCCRAALARMISQGRGTIINVTSISGQRGTPGQTAYSASKAAIVGFSKALAREVGRYGITINCVSPGLIDTEMVSNMKPDVVRRHVESLPVSRTGRPEEVAEVIGFLAVRGPGYLFGQVITIDGGATM
jgi:NAD(P)-dependent dehydrogenase (short-subunit alcohol dehydrogenase family)